MAIPNEYQIYVLASSIMAALFVAAIVRLWLLRKVEETLLKNKAALEKQIVIQQKDLLTVRQESNAWRTEMQRQFDLFRHMASDQLSVEEKRFNELLSKTRQREFELQTALDVTKQMCAELPVAKARVLYLESLGTPATAAPAPAAAPAPTPVAAEADSDEDGGLSAFKPAPVTPLPDLGGNSLPLPTPTNGSITEAADAPPTPKPLPIPSPFFKPAPPPAPSPVIEEGKLTELEQKLAEFEKKNSQLQQALTTTRLKARSRPSSTRKMVMKKQRA